jgi:hypothetical protein
MNVFFIVVKIQGRASEPVHLQYTVATTCGGDISFPNQEPLGFLRLDNNWMTDTIPSELGQLLSLTSLVMGVQSVARNNSKQSQSSTDFFDIPCRVQHSVDRNNPK